MTNQINIRELPVVQKELIKCAEAIKALLGYDVTLDINISHVNISSPAAVQHLQYLICDEFKVRWVDVDGESRDNTGTKLVDARHTFFYLAVKVLRLSTKEAGKQCGNRDHSTVIYARDKIKDFYESGDALIERVENVKLKIQSYLLQTNGQ